MARSSFLALCVLLAACSSSVVPPASPPGTRAPRTAAPTPFNEGAAFYAETVRGFVAAYDRGDFDAALAFIDERFTFGVDCDYESARFYYISDHESATYWLRDRLADHDRIDVLRFVDATGRDNAIGADIARSSDTIARRGYGTTVRPRVPLVVRFSLDGRRLIQIGLAFSTPLPSFSDCLP
jgi:hypothetical protein